MPPSPALKCAPRRQVNRKAQKDVKAEQQKAKVYFYPTLFPIVVVVFNAVSTVRRRLLFGIKRTFNCRSCDLFCCSHPTSL